jgi:hypothetical protein
MMRSTFACVAGAAIGLATVACGGSPTLANVQTIKKLALTSTRVFDGGDGQNRFRVFEIEPVTGGNELRLITSNGVVWITPVGDVVRRVDFTASRTPLFPARRLRNGATDRYVGFAPAKNELVFFNSDGQEDAAKSCSQCWDLATAEIDEPGRDNPFVRAIDGKSARVFSSTGETERGIPATGYLTDLKALYIGDERQASLAFYSSPDPELQEAIRIKNADGQERLRWTIQVQGSVATTRNRGGRPRLSPSTAIISSNGTRPPARCSPERRLPAVPLSARSR